MRTVSAREANHGLSELLSAVEGGEEVVITRHGRPVAKIVPFASALSPAERDEAFARVLKAMRDMARDATNRGIKIPPGGFTRDEMHER